MFGFKPRLPVTDDERAWVDEGFTRLDLMLGAKRLIECAVVLPTDEFFPDPYNGSEDDLRAIYSRVCEYMSVDPSQTELAIIPDGFEAKDLLHEYSLRTNDPGGLHFARDVDGKALIGIKQSLLDEPLAVVATLAHELCHVILLDGGLMSRDAEDMEPMTDLATVYLGLGVFNANACQRFHKFQDDRREGWSMKRLGYLPEIVYGYALAVFARERGEIDPSWAGYLSTNVKAYMKQSANWLSKSSPKPS